MTLTVTQQRNKEAKDIFLNEQVFLPYDMFSGSNRLKEGLEVITGTSHLPFKTLTLHRGHYK